MTPDEWGQFIKDFGLPLALVLLLVFEVLVPKGRLKREEARGDKAMTLGEEQVAATRELTSAVKESAAKQLVIEGKLNSIEDRLNSMERVPAPTTRRRSG